ncbi:MAG: hypothetical protein IKR98_05920 [Bacteroidaceae bacterium]|nr:hypothetical protein [Bacteroidaceae bacterium]
MKKILTFTAFAILGIVSSVAQNTVTADLYHEGNVTHYSGINSLANASNDAISGDTIILSKGDFLSSAITITKPLTIIGSGMDTDSEGQRTVLKNAVTIDIEENNGKDFYLEGLCSENGIYVTNSTEHSQITRCQLKSCQTSDSIYIVQCKIKGLSGNGYKNCSNCHVGPIGTYSNYIMTNCVIQVPYTSNTPYVNPAPNSIFMSCIFMSSGVSDYVVFPASTLAYNCYAINVPNLFNNIVDPSSNNHHLSDFSMFKTFNANSTYEDSCELTDEAAATYLGEDGTQIGMYGGTTPFSSKTSIPQITTFNVDRYASGGTIGVHIGINE